jgi:hypothetical protein
MPNEPAEPADNASQFEFERWRIALRKYVTQHDEYTNFLAQLHSVVYGQCTDYMQGRLKTNPGFDGAANDGIALLRIIKTLMYTVEDCKAPVDELTDRLERLKQGRHVSLQDYYEQFINQADVLDQLKCNLHIHAMALKIAEDNERDEPDGDDIAEAREQALAIRFIRGACQDRYGQYLTSLRNAYLQGNDD